MDIDTYNKMGDAEKHGHFLTIPRNITSQKLICDVGLNDATHATQQTIGNTHRVDPCYNAWQNMIHRCYCPKLHAKHPTYIGCKTCDEWLKFSEFEKWWEANQVEGWSLDKDLLDPDNKTYGPAHCLYVPQHLNKFVTDRAASRGEYPIGVSFRKHSGKFQARARIDGKSVCIGTFACPNQAHNAWRLKKLEALAGLKEICDSIHPSLYDAIKKRYTI